MSDVRCNSNRKPALRASSAASVSSPGAARRPQMHPTRQFTSQIDSIMKVKDSARSRNLCRVRRVPSESESRMQEGNAGAPPMEPDKTPPPRTIFGHLSNRKRPSGAEDETDLIEARRPDILSETIQVKVETTTVKQESEEMCMANCNETIQVTVNTPVASQESPCVLPPCVGLNSTFEVTTTKQGCLSLSPVSSSSDHLGSDVAICAEVDRQEVMSWLEETAEVSDCEERDSTLGGTDSVLSKSESRLIKENRRAGRKKGKKCKDSRRSKRQMSPTASQSTRKHRLDHKDVTHQRKKKVKDSHRKSKKREGDSDDDLRHVQHHSEAKVSSSGRSDDTEASQSDEVFGSKSCSISKHQSTSSYQSALNNQNSDWLNKSSSAPDFIPLKLASSSESLKPDTPYKIPTSPPSPMHAGSPRTPRCPPPRPLFFHESSMLMQQPPPPTMVQGRFQWNTPASPMLSIPFCLPNQLSSQPVGPTMFAPSQEDKRFKCLQSLHHPPRPSLLGYQLIGDSMLLRFSQQLLRESAIFKEGLRFLGYCVSGQKIGDLLKRLRAGFYHLGKKVVLMIGTNDLCRNTRADQMCHELRRVVDLLQKEVEELVIITIPPVPLIENMEHHWNRLHEYNCFIKQLPQKYKDSCTIKPLDTYGIFFDKKIQKCRLDLFELTYSDSTRKDLIHLNKKGLTVIKDQLIKIL